MARDSLMGICGRWKGHGEEDKKGKKRKRKWPFVKYQTISKHSPEIGETRCHLIRLAETVCCCIYVWWRDVDILLFFPSFFFFTPLLKRHISPLLPRARWHRHSQTDLSCPTQQNTDEQRCCYTYRAIHRGIKEIIPSAVSAVGRMF